MARLELQEDAAASRIPEVVLMLFSTFHIHASEDTQRLYVISVGPFLGGGSAFKNRLDSRSSREPFPLGLDSSSCESLGFPSLRVVRARVIYTYITYTYIHMYVCIYRYTYVCIPYMYVYIYIHNDVGARP